MPRQQAAHSAIQGLRVHEDCFAVPSQLAALAACGGASFAMRQIARRGSVDRFKLRGWHLSIGRLVGCERTAAELVSRHAIRTEPPKHSFFLAFWTLSRTWLPLSPARRCALRQSLGATPVTMEGSELGVRCPGSLHFGGVD